MRKEIKMQPQQNHWSNWNISISLEMSALKPSHSGGVCLISRGRQLPKTEGFTLLASSSKDGREFKTMDSVVGVCRIKCSVNLS